MFREEVAALTQTSLEAANAAPVRPQQQRYREKQWQRLQQRQQKQQSGQQQAAGDDDLEDSDAKEDMGRGPADRRRQVVVAGRGGVRGIAGAATLKTRDAVRPRQPSTNAPAGAVGRAAGSAPLARVGGTSEGLPAAAALPTSPFKRQASLELASYKFQRGRELFGSPGGKKQRPALDLVGAALNGQQMYGREQTGLQAAAARPTQHKSAARANMSSKWDLVGKEKERGRWQEEDFEEEEQRDTYGGVNSKSCHYKQQQKAGWVKPPQRQQGWRQEERQHEEEDWDWDQSTPELQGQQQDGRHWREQQQPGREQGRAGLHNADGDGAQMGRGQAGGEKFSRKNGQEQEGWLGDAFESSRQQLGRGEGAVPRDRYSERDDESEESDDSDSSSEGPIGGTWCPGVRLGAGRGALAGAVRRRRGVEQGQQEDAIAAQRPNHPGTHSRQEQQQHRARNSPAELDSGLGEGLASGGSPASMQSLFRFSESPRDQAGVAFLGSTAAAAGGRGLPRLRLRPGRGGPKSSQQAEDAEELEGDRGGSAAATPTPHVGSASPCLPPAAGQRLTGAAAAQPGALGMGAANAARGLGGYNQGQLRAMLLQHYLSLLYNSDYEQAQTLLHYATCSAVGFQDPRMINKLAEYSANAAVARFIAAGGMAAAVGGAAAALTALAAAPLPAAEAPVLGAGAALGAYSGAAAAALAALAAAPPPAGGAPVVGAGAALGAHSGAAADASLGPVGAAPVFAAYSPVLGAAAAAGGGTANNVDVGEQGMGEEQEEAVSRENGAAGAASDSD